jgi:hypothetical protein
LKLHVITDHLEDAQRNITMRAAVRDVFKLLKDEKIREAIRQTVGLRSYDVLLNWVKDVWNKERLDRGQSLSAVAKYSATGAAAVLGMRSVTGLLNFTNFPLMVNKLGVWRTLTALSEFYANPFANWELVDRLSPEMRQRGNDLDVSLAALRKSLKESSRFAPYDRLKEHSLDFIGFTDALFSRPLWLAVYNDAINEETVKNELPREDMESKARLAANKAVWEMLGSGKTLNLSQVQKDTTMKMLTPFYGFANAGFNALAEKGLVNGVMSRAFMKTLFLYVFAQAAMETLIRGYGDDEEDEDKIYSFLKAWGKNTINTAAGGLPIARDLTRFVADVWFDGRAYLDASPNIMALQPVARLGTFAQTVHSVWSETGRKDWTDVGRDFFRFLNSVEGFPDTFTDAFWTSLYWLSSDFEADGWDYLKSVVFDKKLKKAR